MDFLVCLNCDSENLVIDHSRGDYVCHECGAVQENRVLDSQPECHATYTGDDNRRTEWVDPYFSKLADTVISPGSGRDKKKLKTASLDLAQTQKVAQEKQSLFEQHLQNYFSKIRQLTQALELPGRVETAAKDLIVRYEKARGQHRRRNLDIMSACLAILDLVSGQLQLGKPLNDVLSDLKIAQWRSDELPDEREIWATRKKIVKQLPGVDCVMRSEDVVDNFCTTLNVNRALRRVAQHIHTRILPFVEGKSINTVAGGCILLASQALGDETLDRHDVSGVSQVSAPTLQNFCKIGSRHWGLIVPSTAELAKLKSEN